MAQLHNAILLRKTAKIKKNELTHVHVGQKRPFTQKIRSLGQKQAILVFLVFQKR